MIHSIPGGIRPQDVKQENAARFALVGGSWPLLDGGVARASRKRADRLSWVAACTEYNCTYSTVLVRTDKLEGILVCPVNQPEKTQTCSSGRVPRPCP